MAARNALAKTLRRDKRRDEATAVAALRRPGWDDWALDVVAVEAPEVVSSFADAAAAVRDAQAAAIEGRSGPDVRTSLRDLRDATTRLVRQATEVLGRVGREAGSGELNARLSEVAGNASAVEQLRVGVLGAGGDAPSDLFAGLEPAAGSAPSRAPSRTSAPKARRTSAETAPAPPEQDPQAARAQREERRRRKDAHQAALRVQRDAARELAGAEAELDAATTALRRAERKMAEAQQARDDAAAVAADADADVDRTKALVDAESDGSA